MHLSIFISVINQPDAQNFCFTISFFHASTCFEHMCSKHVEASNKLIVKRKFCASSWLITEINNNLYVLLSVRSPCVLLRLCTIVGSLRTNSAARLVRVPRSLIRHEYHNHVRSPVPFINEVNVTGYEVSMSNLTQNRLL